MSLVLKSNVVATKWLFDKTGIKDTDYLFNADFTQNYFNIKPDSNKIFSDIINYTRANSAYYYDGSIKTVPANTPVLLGSSGEKGLWQQLRAGNRLGSGIINSSRTITLSTTAELSSSYCLQVWGSGSVQISGDVQIVSGGNTATKTNPVIFKATTGISSATINFTVSGSVDYYQTQLDDSTALMNPSLTTTESSAIYLKTALLRDEFSMLIRLKPSYIGNSTYQSALFEIASNNNLITGYINTSGLVRIRARNNVDVGITSDGIAHENKDVTIVLKFGKSRLAAFQNGLKLFDIAANATSAIQFIKFLGSDTYVPSGSKIFTGLLKNVVMYTKTMTDTELADLSKTYL
ncbi:hypothetical protein [Acinetobacter soli]|uniref:hypothetical protein n=1 Tax=Acinetobacter soli TaxID=487316 RepID=UPI00125061F2|nr:hypothetical protein [Acinetobacter soli]